MSGNNKKKIIGINDGRNIDTAIRLEIEADILFLKRNFDEALKKYNMAINLLGNAQTFLKRARVYRELGEYESALYDLNQIDKLATSKGISPDHQLYLERALVQERLWDMKSAYEDLTKYISIWQEKKLTFYFPSIKEKIKYCEEWLSRLNVSDEK
jgi:tetratricopeptide (TPR) repeat protein